MENTNNRIRCRYCGIFFRPDPTFKGKASKRVVTIECPRCGNGDTMPYRRYLFRIGVMKRA